MGSTKKALITHSTHYQVEPFDPILDRANCMTLALRKFNFVFWFGTLAQEHHNASELGSGSGCSERFVACATLHEFQPYSGMTIDYKECMHNDTSRKSSAHSLVPDTRNYTISSYAMYGLQSDQVVIRSEPQDWQLWQVTFFCGVTSILQKGLP
jgi:hypothetical protein